MQGLLALLEWIPIIHSRIFVVWGGGADLLKGINRLPRNKQIGRGLTTAPSGIAFLIDSRRVDKRHCIDFVSCAIEWLAKERKTLLMTLLSTKT